ncbi:hypothetical protein ACWCSD_06600 [Nonomuraea sp. NPDC001684]
MSKDRIPEAVQKALFLVSRGYCYAPKCQRRVVQILEDGNPYIYAFVAHICGEPNGPRHDPSMSIEERTSFSNMLLLCDGHHKQIDRKPSAGKYPVELLRAWKKDREGDYATALNGLTGLTEDGLKDLMATAITETKNDLFNAIGDLKSASRETVDTLRSLVLEAFNHPYDSVQMLHEAAMRLSHLQDNTTLLHEAAMRLSHLQDNTSFLYEAAHDLKHLQDTASQLRHAASRLEHLPASTDRLWAMSSKLTELEDQVRLVNTAGEDVPWHLVEQFISASRNVTRSTTENRSTTSTTTSSETQLLIDAATELRDVSVTLQEVEGTGWPPSPSQWIWIKRAAITGAACAFAIAGLIAWIATRTSA